MAEGQWKIGSVVVTRVAEQDAAIPAAAFFPGSTAEEIAGLDWLTPWAVEAGNVKIVIQALCLEADGTRIVVDTCVGQRPLPDMYAAMANDGSFLGALADAGFAREDVDVVICTHLHFDHVGWNTMRDADGRWVPTFPNARYVLARPEYEHWRAAGAEARVAASAVTFDDAVTPLFDFDVVDLVDVDHQVTPSVSLVPTPGHSPGHVSVRIVSGGAEALVTGDCVHSPIQLTRPEWGIVVDADPEQSSTTRRALVDRCCDRDVLVIGTHFPPPTAGHVVSDPGGGARFRPLA
jgi:glyoxylase-like metal-dependent hydrolase (beta-lactamase superfamily II)